MSGTPERAGRPALNRDRILQTALAIIDRDGLEAFSMRRLGAELGVDPMAVYRHLPNKGAVLDGIVELMWTRGLVLDSSDTEAGWQAVLATVMRDIRRELLAHPNVVALLATHPLASTEEQYAFLERVLERLEQSGLSAGPELLPLLNVLGVYTLGHLTAEVSEPAGGAGGQFDAERLDALAANYPRLVGMLGPTGLSYQPEEQYEHGLNAILAGWSAESSPPKR